MNISKFSKETIDTQINVQASSQSLVLLNPDIRRCLMAPTLVSLHLSSGCGDNANIPTSLQKHGSKVVMEHLYSVLSANA